AIIIWVEATFIMVTPRFTAIDFIVFNERLGSAVIRVPSHEGLLVLKMCTGILRSMAGNTVLGWRTLAPKYDSSAASSKETTLIRLAAATMRGSAVIRPSTSVQISIAPAPSAAPMIAAE